MTIDSMFVMLVAVQRQSSASCCSTRTRQTRAPSRHAISMTTSSTRRTSRAHSAASPSAATRPPTSPSTSAGVTSLPSWRMRTRPRSPEVAGCATLNTRPRGGHIRWRPLRRMMEKKLVAWLLLPVCQPTLHSPESSSIVSLRFSSV